MSLLQVQIDDILKEAIQSQSVRYGVPASSLVRIVLVDAFLADVDSTPGNVFNADRDNHGKGIPAVDFLKLLKNAR